MKNIIKDENKFFDIVIWGIVIVFTVLSFSLIFNINVTTDEIFSLNMSKLGPKGILEVIADDNHPPLYYIYGSFFEFVFPGNIYIQKFASIIPALATMILVAVLFRRDFGNISATLILLFYTCVPCTLEYSVQIRMYTMSIFFVTLCGYECYLCFKENRNRDYVLMSIAAIGAAYTVYFALIAVVWEIGLLFVILISRLKNSKSRILKLFISILVMIVSYTPMIPVFIHRVDSTGSDYFLPNMSFEVIWDFFKWTFDLEVVGGFVYLFLAILVLVGVLGLILLFSKDTSEVNRTNIKLGFLSMLIPTLTTLSGIIISIFHQPIYTGRYVIIEMMMLAIYFGLVGGSVLKEYNNRKKENGKTTVEKIIVALICLVLTISGCAQYYECFRQEYVGHLTQETVDFFNEHLGPKDYVLYNYEAMGFDYAFYFPDDRLFYVRNFDFENTDYENIWFLSNLYEWPITDADCYNYWISYEFIGTYGVEDNNFDVYRYFHNDFPKIEPVL